MPKHEFKVGDKVRMQHNIIEGDYHRGDCTLAKKDETGIVEALCKRYDGQQYVYVRLDNRWPAFQPIICLGYQLELLGDPLDQFVTDVFKEEEH